jgi:hypothetical protein
LLPYRYANEESAYQHPVSGNSSNRSEALRADDEKASDEERHRRAFYGAFGNNDEARAAERTLELAAVASRQAGDASIWEAPLFRLPHQPGQDGAGGAGDASALIKGPLRQRDWRHACRAAYHSRLSDIPSGSFKEAFTEVIHLMREAQVDMDESSMRTLLRFLVYTDPDTELTQRILRRVHRDRSIQVSHIECISLTSVMMRRVPEMQQGQGEGRIFLARPLYKSPNYLFVYPAALSFMFDAVVKNAEFLGPDFLKEFEVAWRNTHAAQGRRRLWKLLNSTLEDESVGGMGRRQELVREASMDDARRCLAMLCIYSSYLVGSNGMSADEIMGRGGGATGTGMASSSSSSSSSSSFRPAYDLLYSAETMMQEAERRMEDKDRMEPYQQE